MNKKLTKAELIKRLRELAKEDSDLETVHIEADELLLKFINSRAVSNAFNEVGKWYA